MNKKIQLFILVATLAVCLGGAGLSQQSGAPDVDYKKNNGSVTIHAENIELSKLLRLLSIREQVNIISATPLKGTVCVNLYGVTLEQVLDAVLKPSGYDFQFQDGVYLVMKEPELEDYMSPSSPQVVRLFRLNYLNHDEAEKFIKPFLSGSGEVIVGEKPTTGLSAGLDESGGVNSASTSIILVKDYVTVLDRVAEALEALDVRPRQVLVEATILEVFLDDSCKLGVDFNALGGIDFSDLNSTSDVYSFLLSGTASGDQLEDRIWGVRDTGFAPDNPTEGFSFGILNDKVAAFVYALENVVDTNVIANPKVLALNKQKAEIMIGGRLGYYGTSVVSDGIAQQSVEFLDTGTQLKFRPFISGEGFVRLEIHPQRSNGVVDATTGLPSENTSEVTTNIMVKDGDTVVIGGLIEEKDSIIEKSVPFLGSIPVLGRLFKYTENSTERTEIITLITPHILDPAEPNGNAEELLDEFEERKRLFKEGFPFCSRTIWADRHVAKARKCYQQGELQWAKYHIERVVDLDPHHEQLVETKRLIDAALVRTGQREKPLFSYLKEELE
jgi:type IV pilus assembly protein PilQ